MAIRNQLMSYLYSISKSDPLKYTRASDLLTTLKQSQNCTDEEFYQALKYLEDKEYIQGEVASYRITGDGIEFIEQDFRNYPKEPVELQRKANNYSYNAVIVGILGVVVTLVLYFYDKFPSVHTKPSGQPPRVVYSNIDSSVWFNKPYQAIPSYIPESINNAAGNEAERELSYFRIFRHANDCQSADIGGVLVQVIFFRSDAGSKAYFTEAFAEIRDTNPEITNSVGDTSYFRKYSQVDGHCNSKITDMYSLVFQRYNAIGVIKMWSVPNSMNDKNVKEWVNQIATELDTTFKENSR